MLEQGWQYATSNAPFSDIEARAALRSTRQLPMHPVFMGLGDLEVVVIPTEAELSPASDLQPIAATTTESGKGPLLLMLDDRGLNRARRFAS